MESTLEWIIELKQSVIAWITGRSASHRPGVQKLRSKEIAWRAHHGEELKRLAGQWVALEGNYLVAHDPDVANVIRSARSRGIAVPYVFYVDESPSDVIKIGI